MGWLLFLLLEQNYSCSEPVAKEWCVWDGHHSASNGYGQRSHYLSPCFGRSIHFSSSLKCMCSCLNKYSWCVHGIIVLGANVRDAAFHNIINFFFLFLLCLFIVSVQFPAVSKYLRLFPLQLSLLHPSYQVLML